MIEYADARSQKEVETIIEFCNGTFAAGLKEEVPIEDRLLAAGGAFSIHRALGHLWLRAKRQYPGLDAEVRSIHHVLAPVRLYLIPEAGINDLPQSIGPYRQLFELEAIGDRIFDLDCDAFHVFPDFERYTEEEVAELVKAAQGTGASESP